MLPLFTVESHPKQTKQSFVDPGSQVFLDLGPSIMYAKCPSKKNKGGGEGWLGGGSYVPLTGFSTDREFKIY